MIPIPPEELRERVHGKDTIEAFLAVGRREADLLKTTLGYDGRLIAGHVLDFGCGCGRTLRWLGEEANGEQPKQTENHCRLYGTDIHRDSIDWCSRNIPFAVCGENYPNSPLGYQSATFDIIYAFSVFTHLDLAMQTEWLREFYRLLKPGGAALISTHGPSKWINPDFGNFSTLLFTAGHCFWRPDNWGAEFPPWYGVSCHSPVFAKELFEGESLFKVKVYLPGELFNFQDIYLLEKGS